MNTEASIKKQPLDDIMLAMDVVDTLRHRNKMVERELNMDARDQDLKERLRKIYQAQGIDVPDHIIEEGVAALKEDRFTYTPTPDSISRKMAEIYVSRNRWGKWVIGLLTALIIGWGVYQFAVVGPRSALPDKIDQTYRMTVQAAKSEPARKKADQKYAQAKAALRLEDYEGAKAELAAMNKLLTLIEQQYTLRVISEQGQQSGIWRIPDINTQARNYYIIVQAVDPSGHILAVPISNEETGKTETVDKWGIRVDERVFNRIRADKQDDGIIQNNRIGVKHKGYLQPEYLIPTTGASITQW